MTALIVAAHPDQDSLTLALARRLAEELQPAELADLAAEGFDPRFSAADRHTYRVAGEYPADVASEQRRLDAAEHLVLVFPVYWWSMPGLMKGWIDRVFVNGWAFEIDPADGMRRKLGGLTVHLLPIAGDSAGVYDRHAYEQSLRTQIEHGVVEYCGAVRGTTAFVHDSEQEDAAARAASVDRAVAAVVAAVRGQTAVPAE
ncbi:NAD(P)H dehydrogenase (quinone) [Rathayibacter sp. PhB93]|uniref:NAD(P)H-dependent oxidoreductase n=1 Tax=unclassified Rathayibacter TaxID=2609250 RepID=UPI000F493367|nr:MULTISPECIES: NAD(P)H-dependent oxidoreductase [unclassified Rathayibacter]ROQ06755.1 NAD(P)H dehydrogenase (quinone) [Rathayibacter sp. PhB93]TDQ14512.1 NAD(P)H dehydrogenase (quinone) [Rathayibacter sp. PhB1]